MQQEDLWSPQRHSARGPKVSKNSRRPNKTRLQMASVLHAAADCSLADFIDAEQAHTLPCMGTCIAVRQLLDSPCSRTSRIPIVSRLNTVHTSANQVRPQQVLERPAFALCLAADQIEQRTAMASTEGHNLHQCVHSQQRSSSPLWALMRVLGSSKITAGGGCIPEEQRKRSAEGAHEARRRRTRSWRRPHGHWPE